jgi:hypothetical protein
VAAAQGKRYNTQAILALNQEPPSIPCPSCWLAFLATGRHSIFSSARMIMPAAPFEFLMTVLLFVVPLVEVPLIFGSTKEVIVPVIV